MAMVEPCNSFPQNYEWEKILDRYAEYQEQKIYLHEFIAVYSESEFVGAETP